MTTVGKGEPLELDKIPTGMPVGDSIADDPTKQLVSVPRKGMPPINMLGVQAVQKRTASNILKRWTRETPTLNKAGVLSGAGGIEAFELAPQNIEDPDIYWLRFSLLLPGGATALQFQIPSPWELFQQINFMPNKIGTEGDMGKPVGDILVFSLQLLAREHLKACKRLGIDSSWNEGATLFRSVSQEFAIPILATAFTQPGCIPKALFKKDLRIEFVWATNKWTQPFYTTGYTSTTAATDAGLVQLGDMYLEAQTTVHHFKNDNLISNLTKDPLAISFYDPAVFTSGVQTINAGDTVEIPFALPGHYTALLLYLTNVASNNIRFAQRQFGRWNEFSLVNESSVNIQGGLTTLWNQFRDFIYPQNFASGGKWLDRNPGFCACIFSENLGLALGSGQINGVHRLTGDEKARFVMKSAGTNAVVRFTTAANTTGATAALTPSIGSFRFWFRCPLTKKIAWSVPIAFNATVLTILDTIYNIESLDKKALITLSVNGSAATNSAATPFSGAVTTFDLTFSGSYGNMVITPENVGVEPLGLSNGTLGVTFIPSVLTPGVDGHTNGSYQLRVIGLRHSLILNSQTSNSSTHLVQRL